MPNEFYLIITSTLAFTALTLVWLCYLLNTDMFLKFGLKLCRTYAGLRVHHVSRKNGRGIWCYAEKGRHHRHRRHGHGHRKPHRHAELDSSAVSSSSSSHDEAECIDQQQHDQHQHQHPTLVFLHGFGGDKDTWPSILKGIPSHYHCVVVDLPGHGDTTFDETIDEPNVESYVKSLREFLEVTGLDQSKIYLIGCSFGGAVAALFTAMYPECVENLALLCPAIKTPVLTETCQELLNGNYNLLIPENGDQFIRMISLLCQKTQYYPHRIMQSFVNINFTPERQSLLKKLLQSLVTTDMKNFETELQHKFNAIKAPTLIIWGENDNMLHVSGAKFLNERIENSKLKIINDCNHVLQLDQPGKTRDYLLEFIKKRD